MSKNKDVRRGIVLYLDGKRVENNVRSIKAEVQRLTRELNKMTVAQLKELAAELGVKLSSSARKAEIIETIQNA